MSNTASLELSQALYELSGWDDWGTDSDLQWYSKVVNEGDVKVAPKYSAGYLLRKLPSRISLTKGEYYGATWSNEYGTLHHSFTGKTPEDALVKLCLRLIEEGILPISGRD